MPNVTGPLGQSWNYFSNGEGDGVFIIGASLLSLVLIFTKKYELLRIAAGASFGLIAYDFYYALKILNGSSSGEQMGLGWILLFGGAVLVFVAAVIKQQETET
ncbi:MAG: hypothetical protein ACYC5A_02635 [Thermoleophilia bacterium]